MAIGSVPARPNKGVEELRAREQKTERKGGDYSSQSAANVMPEAPTRDKLKFSTMTNDFPAMMAQAVAGIKQITATKEMIQRLVKMDQDNIKRMEKVLSEETQRMNKVQESDGIILFSGVAAELLMSLGERLEHSKQATEHILEEVIDPLTTLEKTSMMSLKSITTTMKGHEQDLKKVLDSMNKSKDVCRKSLQFMQECQEKEKAEINPKKRLEWADKTVAARKQAAENATAVMAKIVEANRANEFFAAGVRGCIDQIEELETQRIAQLTVRLDRWTVLTHEADQQQVAVSEAAVNIVREVNPEHCIQTYVFDWMVDFGNPHALEPFVYDLPLTVGEIQAGNVLTKGFQMFNLPLTQLLEKEKNPSKELLLNVPSSSMLSAMQMQERSGKALDVPLIMYVLCDAIKSMGGLKTPNIFRISIDAGLLTELQRQFDSGNFALELMRNDPHAPACLLKLWLRSLSEPIIHRSFYQLATQGLQEMKSTAVAVRRETRIQLRSRTSDAPNRPNLAPPDSQRYVMGIFNKLAGPYQALVRKIASLARDVVAHADVNFMSYDSLAVVFAPAFFRTPRPDDPNEGIQQSHREKLFVMELLMALAQEIEAARA